MSARFHRFDRNVHTSYEWLDYVAARIDGERRDAYHAMHAVLGALRDRMPVDAAVALASQMPLLVRGVFYDGYEPMRRPHRARAPQDFVAAVTAALAPAPRIDPQQAIDAVLAVLETHLERSVFDGLASVLPADLRACLGRAVPAVAPAAPAPETASTVAVAA